MSTDWFRDSLGWSKRALLFVLKEPAIHFLILGSLIAICAPRGDRSEQDRTITVTRAEVQRVSNGYRMQFGDSPSATQLQTLLNDYVDDEIAFREARRLGLGLDDEIVRRRLIQKYRFLQRDLAIPAAPSREDLLRFYASHGDWYRELPRVTFRHVFFASDEGKKEGSREAANALASRLNAANRDTCSPCGDRFDAGSFFSDVSQADIEKTFGRSEFSGSVLNIKSRKWSQALRSGFGWHIVFVMAQEPQMQKSFDACKETVLQDFVEWRRKKTDEELNARLRERYVIMRE